MTFLQGWRLGVWVFRMWCFRGLYTIQWWRGLGILTTSWLYLHLLTSLPGSQEHQEQQLPPSWRRLAGAIAMNRIYANRIYANIVPTLQDLASMIATHFRNPSHFLKLLEGIVYWSHCCGRKFPLQPLVILARRRAKLIWIHLRFPISNISQHCFVGMLMPKICHQFGIKKCIELCINWGDFSSNNTAGCYDESCHGWVGNLDPQVPSEE